MFEPGNDDERDRVVRGVGTDQQTDPRVAPELQGRLVDDVVLEDDQAVEETQAQRDAGPALDLCEGVVLVQCSGRAAC